MKKRGSTLFLRTAVILIGLIVLVLCALVLPAGIRSPHAGGYRPILMGMYLPALPFFLAGYQIMKLLGYIDRGQIFSPLSVKALNIITYCGLVISGLYAIGLPYIFMTASRDDAPGVVLLGLIFTFAPLVVAVLAAVLQRLLQNAIDIKSENDLTV